MVSEFVAYIDEAGDEGFGKLGKQGRSGQSQWLLLGAAIVSKQNDRHLPQWRNDIMALFPSKQSLDLHFRKLNHEQRVAACKHLSTKQIGVSVVASNKITLLSAENKEVFKRKGHLYNYIVRFLLERVTASCARAARRDKSSGAKLRVVFSRRGGTDYHSMRDYLCFMRDGREVFQPVQEIDWQILDPANIEVANHSNKAGLQVADIVTSATSAALEPNAFGNSEPRYALELRDRFLSNSKRIANSGLTILPRPQKNPLNSDQRAFLEAIEKKVRAPGS